MPDQISEEFAEAVRNLNKVLANDGEVAAFDIAAYITCVRTSAERIFTGMIATPGLQKDQATLIRRDGIVQAAEQLYIRRMQRIQSNGLDAVQGPEMFLGERRAVYEKFMALAEGIIRMSAKARTEPENLARKHAQHLKQTLISPGSIPS